MLAKHPTFELKLAWMPEKTIWAGCQWLTPVILATQEADIRRIAFGSQLQQTIYEILSQKNSQQKGLVE
jgi:hypothetical protein